MLKEILLVLGMLLLVSGCYKPDQVITEPVAPVIPPVEEVVNTTLQETEDIILVENVTELVAENLTINSSMLNVTAVNFTNVTQSKYKTNTKYFVNNFAVSSGKASLTLAMFPSNTTYNTTCSASYDESNCTMLENNRSMFLYLNYTKINFNEKKGNYSVEYDLTYDAKRNH